MVRISRDFGFFWVSQTLSVAGDSFSYIALPLLVLHATGSVTQMGLLTGVGGVAAVVAGIFAGHLVDRYDRRRLMIGADLVRALLYAAVPVAWAFSPQVWLLYVVVPLGAALGKVFQVAYVTAIPALVEKERITEANGRLYATYSGAAVAGPMLAGVLSASAGPVAAVAVDAATFAVSALGLVFVRLRASGASEPARGGFLAGVRFLWRHPVLRPLTLALALLTFLMMALTDLFIYRLKHDLGQSDAVVGVAMAASAAGSVLASLVVARARRTLGFGVSWLGSYVLCGIAVALLAVTGAVPAIALLITAYSLGTGVAGICSMSLRQEVTPEPLLGRVTSAFWTIHTAPGPIGAALLTTAAAAYGTPAVFAATGAVFLVLAGAAALTPVRRSRPEEATA
nr:MFS transporter [Bailinhaonella thermotolerans]